MVSQQNSEGTINFKLLPSDSKSGQRESKVRVRAHFDYHPENDPYIPCKEAGLQFVRGDVLHIVSQVNMLTFKMCTLRRSLITRNMYEYIYSIQT